MPELSRQRRYLVLAICCLSLFVVGMDATIINVALPAIGRDFRAPVSGLQWTVDAYILVVASLLMLAGSTGDRVVIGLWGAMFGLSVAVGPIVGGALVDSAGWRGVFWINIPVGIAAIALTARYVPESRAAVKRRLDPFGQILVIAALGTLSYGIIEGPDLGWGAAPIIGCFTAAAVAVAVLIAWSRRAAEPLIDLRFFRSLPFSGAALTAITGMCAFGGFLFLITLYLQEVRGYSALVAGAFLVPMALAMACSAPVCGRVMARIGTRVPLLIAGTGITAGGVLLTFLTATSSVWYVLLACLVLGCGMGWVNAPATNNAVAGMPRARAGTASGVVSTGRQIGSSLGVAVTGSVLAVGLHGPLSTGFASATRPAWWIVAAMGLCVVTIALVTTGRAGQASAARAAALIEHADSPLPQPARAA